MDHTEAGAGDDQGSGWFEVKKKHRSSSKFSIRNWVGGPSRQPAKGRHPNNKHQPQSAKLGKDVVQRGVGGHSSTSKENEKDGCCLDKSVVSTDCGLGKMAPLKVITTTSSDSTSIVNDVLSEKKPGIVHKIKWGDLEDELDAPYHGSCAVSEIRFGEIGEDDLAMCGTCKNLCDSNGCNLSKDCPAVSKEIVEVSKVAGDDCHNKLSISVVDSLEGKCTDVKEVISSDTEKLLATRKTTDMEGYDMKDKKIVTDAVEHPNTEPRCAFDPSNEESSISIAEDPIKIMEVPAPNVSSDVGKTGLSTVDTDSDDARVIFAQNAEANSSDQSLLEAPLSSISASAISGDLVIVPSEDNASKSSIKRNVEGPEVGETKERFRERLWSFLFENLNRAIDELYLLCELECDLEQVKEATLVLQEAESDFKELNSRVEEFDRMKKNSSQSISGPVMSLKGDHKRPHALSWEVRRMTTSPHRAEILSSSLEVFKKIQKEREKERAAGDATLSDCQSMNALPATAEMHKRSLDSETSDLESKARRKSGSSDSDPINTRRERKTTSSGRSSKTLVQNSHVFPLTSFTDPNTSKLPPRSNSAAFVGGKGRKEQLGSSAVFEKYSDTGQTYNKHIGANEKEERDRRNSQSWRPINAWKEKRNWEEILTPPGRLSSRLSHSPCMSRKSAERARILHDKLMSPEKKKKTALDLRKEAEEKHARAMRIRSELESEKIQRLQRESEKQNRATEFKTVRNMKLKEVMHARHQRSESRHEAYIAKVVKRAGDESVKVNEVRFITSLNEENKKFLLLQKHRESEMRRAEKYQVLKTKQKEDMAREEAVVERRKLIEAEKLQRLAEMQRRKEEALLRREEERKASSAAREARAMEQLRKKEERAKAQQEEAELLAQRLAERLSESEQRRKVYLEQIRERASMDYRDQSSPLMRRTVNKESQGRTTPPANVDDNQENSHSGCVDSGPAKAGIGTHQCLKRRIKKIRQRLMALKHDLPEIPSADNAGIGYRTTLATARAKVGRWLQELQRLRQERKEGAASIGLITADMIKFLEGKELELQACRRAGLLDFISSALPASHISKPEACQVTTYLLRLLKVVLFVPTNKIYFLSQNFLPPLIPMLLAALESYIKIAASLNISGSSNPQLSKNTSENFDSISEVVEGFLWTVTMIIGLPTSDERQRAMQDGLLELVISYQIIHRLRDLFALYDRPQVEGSPFPSSILLSINLLVVLTSTRCTISAIDWEGLSVPQNEVKASNLLKTVDSGCALVQESPSELKLLPSAADQDSSGLSGLQANGNTDNSPKGKVLNDGMLSGEVCEKEQSHIPVEMNSNSQQTKIELIDTKKVLDSNISASNMSLKGEKLSSTSGMGKNNGQRMGLKQPHEFLLSTVSETGLVSLPSLLTAVLLQANSKQSAEQGSCVLPSNFEEVATAVLKVLNNLALMDISFMQRMLARLDLKMEFFHIMSFLLTHCTSNWKVASDQVGLLLLESLSLLGYFSLLHPGNQAVLRWGNSPTILHKVCDLPFAFFSDPELMPILAGTLVAACFGCEQNRGVVEQELSTDMILSLVKSSKSSLTSTQPRSPTGNPLVEDSTENSTLEPRKSQGDVSMKPIRSTVRNSRVSQTKIGVLGGGKISKSRNFKDSRTGRISEDSVTKLRSDAVLEAPVTLPLYSRFPESFFVQAEQFFLMEPISNNDEAQV